MRILRLTPAHAAQYRAVMLTAYAEAREVFTSTVPEREALPLEWWTSRVSDAPDATELVLGAFADGRLAGVAGLRFGRRERTRHKALLFGMYVLASYRHRGVARALVEAVLAEARARPGTRVVRLTVTEPNVPAVRLYASCGFVPFGTEPLAIKVGERFVSLVHMWRSVGEGDHAG